MESIIGVNPSICPPFIGLACEALESPSSSPSISPSISRSSSPPSSSPSSSPSSPSLSSSSPEAVTLSRRGHARRKREKKAEKYAKIFELYLNGHSLRQIEKITEIPRTTIHRHLHKQLKLKGVDLEKHTRPTLREICEKQLVPSSPANVHSSSPSASLLSSFSDFSPSSSPPSSGSSPSFLSQSPFQSPPPSFSASEFFAFSSQLSSSVPSVAHSMEEKESVTKKCSLEDWDSLFDQLDTLRYQIENNEAFPNFPQEVVFEEFKETSATTTYTH